MIKFVCKLYLLLCLGLSTNASPILNGLKTTSSDYQQSDSSHHESLFPINSDFGNMETKFNLQSGSTVDQSLKNTPGITTTYRDQNGNLVTQVKKETYNKENGQSSHAFEIQESKQNPNGYSKSFKKEYSSSSVIGSQPTFVQKPFNTEKYYNSEQILNGESSSYGQSSQSYQGQSIPANVGNMGIKSNFKSTVDQSLTNTPGVTSTFRDQNGNIVTQVKKEIVTNTDGQNGHATEFEETKQFPNGYSKSFKKEYSSSSVISAHPTLIKDTNTEKNTYLPQKFTQGDTEKFNGYNTFFNNQKYTSNPISPISSQVFNNKKQSETAIPLNGNSFGSNTKDETNCDERCSTSFTNQGFKQQALNSNFSPVGQVPVNMDHISTQKQPIGQKFEKIESFSTQTQEEVGQKSVNLHGHSNPSQIGQQSVDISNQYAPKKPIGQKFEKIESFSTQTQEEVGQQSVDLHGYSNPSQIGQQSVDISNQYAPKKPIGQKFEKIESFSTQTQEEVGQQSVDLHGYSNPSQIGQQSVDISNQYAPKKPIGQKFEKIESFSTQTQEEVGQQSVDLHGYSNPSQIGQQSVDISNQYAPKKPIGQKFEKIESFSTQTQEEVGQQSVDLHGYSNPSQIGQQSVVISNQYAPKKKPIGQKFEKIESFSTQTQEEVGQQSVDLHGYSNPSQIGQQSVDISNLYAPNKPIGQQFEKIESSYQNKQDLVGQQTVNFNVNDKSSQQYGTGQQIFSQPISGQQIQGSEFFKSNYGGTSQLLDLGVLREQPTEYIRAPGQQNMNSNKYVGQQSIGVFESQSTIEKNINLSSADQLQTDVDGYQGNVHSNNYQTHHDHSMKNPAFKGQQTIDYTSDFEGHKPTYQKQYGNIDFQSSKLSSQTGQLSTGNNEPINSKYNSVFDKLGQLEHEILGAKSTVNINKGNVQTAYSTNHNVKSMPVQTSQQESHFSKTINENTQYIEPESEIAFSKSLKTDSKLVVQQDTIENQTSNNDHFLENPSTPSSVWRKIGDKFKGTIENAKNKAQQLASNINDKVGFSSITGNPC
ncbi:uncharacterized protein LOC111042856 isoform X2 [Myzus persicae]|uniref:uncharacterized protein LOC111042856 isoform X2 n=1 Tax=Myzus persicae TaxID=13164 RepID=UPI000B935A6B|nr:uncharacterized protein LOC111042856 isoform X2 [Myzus persicae]